MMNRLVLRAAVLAAIGGMTGCSNLFGPEGYFRDRGDDYLNADVIEPIKLPEGVTQQGIEDLYRVPSIATDEVEITQAFEVPRPQVLSDNAFTDRVKIQKLGSKRWILVSASPAEVWPQVRGFLSRNNLEVVYTDAATGTIETGWLKFKGEENTKDKYRLQIEQGVQPESTEIHVLHMSVDKNIPGRGQVNWPSASINQEREAWMRDELAATIASDKSGGQAASLLAQTIGLSDKVKVDSDGSEPVLKLALAHSRAWATVGHAVKQSGFSLWEQDDVTGIFYVHYEPVSEEDTESGFMSGWFGSDDDETETPKTPYSLEQVLTHLQLDETEENRKIFSSVKSQAASMLDDVPGYLVVVRGENNNVEVRIRDGYARVIDTREAKELLNVIRNNLI